MLRSWPYPDPCGSGVLGDPDHHLHWHRDHVAVHPLQAFRGPALNDSDTTDLRSGAPINDALIALLPLVGRWQGDGVGVVPATGEQFRYEQQISFAHDGRPFLIYESRTALVDDAGAVIRPSAREVGFWRPGAGQDDIEAQIVVNSGVALNFAGAAGDQRWELQTSVVSTTPTAKRVVGERRLYALIDGNLVYVTELAYPDAEYRPHLNARLNRA